MLRRLLAALVPLALALAPAPALAACVEGVCVVTADWNGDGVPDEANAAGASEFHAAGANVNGTRAVVDVAANGDDHEEHYPYLETHGDLRLGRDKGAPRGQANLTSTLSDMDGPSGTASECVAFGAALTFKTMGGPRPRFGQLAEAWTPNPEHPCGVMVHPDDVLP